MARFLPDQMETVPLRQLPDSSIPFLSRSPSIPIQQDCPERKDAARAFLSLDAANSQLNKRKRIAAARL